MGMYSEKEMLNGEEKMKGRKPIPVDIYDSRGRYYCTTPSIREAAKVCNCSYGNAHHAIYGLQKRARHFILKLHTEDFEAV